MSQNRAVVGWFLLQLVAASALGSVARAAELREVSSFGDNPTSTRMFIYVPDQLAAMPPVLVAIHYCTGSAQAFFTGTTYRSQADRHGFIVIYPETTASDKCFDVHSEGTLKHDGGGESTAIANMVRYTLREYRANAQRVYVTGTSSGAMMTNVMLGAYPELFRAGAAFAGVPFGCFAGPNRWNGECADGKITKTGQQWGDLVRAAYPGFMGPRPRMQLWHGDRDETLSFHNFGEEIKQWTHVLGVSEMPTSTEQGAPESGWTRTRYADSAGVVRVEAMVGTGMPHNLKVLSDEAVRFFGLDADRDPVPAAAGGGGAGGLGGAGAGGVGAAGMAASVAGSQSMGASSSTSPAAAGGAGAAVVGAASAGSGGAAALGSAGAPAKLAAASGARAGAAGVPAAGAARVSAADGGGAGTVAAAGGSATQLVGDEMPAAAGEPGGCNVGGGQGLPPRGLWLILAGCCVLRARRKSWDARV